ncbi:MAG: diguanylate cyclase [Gallionella sp.]
MTKASEVEAMVNLQHPSHSHGDNLWIYQPIYPEQVPLDEHDVTPVSYQIGAVILEMSWVRTANMKARMAWITIGSSAAFLMTTYLLVYLASRNIIFPIRRLSHTVRSIGGGQLETRADTALHIAELETLAGGINDMAAKLREENAILHRRMEDAVRIAAVAFESHEGMLIADPANVIIKVNDAFTRISGYTEAEVVGNTPGMLSSGHHDASFYSAMWETINSTGLWQGEIWNRRKSGEVYPAWVNITAIEREGDEIAYYVGTYTDITTRKAAENEIKQLAFNDALTLLPNRRKLIDLLSKAMAISRRSHRYGALMFIDLDNFKPLNDQYGHESGDSLLIEVANRLTMSVREVDTVARFGGDEFVVMLTELDEDIAASKTQAGIVAEKLFQF